MDECECNSFESQFQFVCKYAIDIPFQLGPVVRKGGSSPYFLEGVLYLGTKGTNVDEPDNYDIVHFTVCVFFFQVRDNCYPNPCRNAGICHDRKGLVQCSCQRGFKGVNCTGRFCFFAILL